MASTNAHDKTAFNQCWDNGNSLCISQERRRNFLGRDFHNLFQDLSRSLNDCYLTAGGIEGDGLGEIIAIRLESPQHISYGAVADRYVTVDFSGWRYFRLVETESARWSDYAWNDSKSLYNVYREAIPFGAVESVKVWYQNLPPGKEVRCRIGPVKALPMTAAAVNDPTVTVNGAALAFPIEMAPGHWIERKGADDWMHYGPKGEELGKVTPQGAPPTLRAGENQLQFSCAPGKGAAPRAKVTVFSRGEQL